MDRIRRTLKRFLYVLPLILVSCSNQCEQPKQLVFILAGQSNMAGLGRNSELTGPLKKLLIIPSNVKLYKRWQRLGYFGPEASLVQEISRLRSDSQCILIKFAINCSSLLSWDPEWSPEKARLTANEKHGPVYPGFMRFIQDLTKDRNVRFEAMFWMQGERDARYPEAARMYLSNFEKLISRIRNDLNTPDLPIFFGQINPPHTKFPAVEIVRGAQTQAAKNIHNVKLISTDGL